MCFNFTAVLVEDIRTLHGRRTKRINVANLIRGVRKPKLQTSQTKTVATVPKAKEVVIEKVSPRNIFRKNVPVPSDVAESAEILASLSNEISQKDLSQGIILNVNVEQTDCLKDKTNNQESEDVSNTVALSSEEEPQVVNIKLESANVNEENASFDDEAHDDEAISDPLIEDDEDVGNSETEESGKWMCCISFNREAYTVLAKLKFDWLMFEQNSAVISVNSKPKQSLLWQSM